MSDPSRPAVLITGVSSGIGAVYADRFARRGHDLVLVARDQTKLEELAERLHGETGVAVDVVRADLIDANDLATVEACLRDDARVGVLVNNAGAGLPGGFANANLDAVDRLIRLNVTSVARLAVAVTPRFLAQGGGAIINVSSVLAVAPEGLPGLYPATKAFVLSLSQSMQQELGPRGIYVQAVLPAATRTDIWRKMGRDPAAIAGMMDVGTMVDAALVGFDRREAITIPSLPDAAQWEAFNAARMAMLPNFRQSEPAVRYRALVMNEAG